MIHYTVKVTSKQSAQLLHARWQSNTVWLSLGHKLQCVTESCDRKWLLLTSWENISFSRWLKLASSQPCFSKALLIIARLHSLLTLTFGKVLHTFYLLALFKMSLRTQQLDLPLSKTSWVTWKPPLIEFFLSFFFFANGRRSKERRSSGSFSREVIYEIAVCTLPQLALIADTPYVRSNRQILIQHLKKPKV